MTSQYQFRTAVTIFGGGVDDCKNILLRISGLPQHTNHGLNLTHVAVTCKKKKKKKLNTNDIYKEVPCILYQSGLINTPNET